MISLSLIAGIELADHAPVEPREFEHIGTFGALAENSPLPIASSKHLADRYESVRDSLP